jgi:hypothetical protein
VKKRLGVLIVIVGVLARLGVALATDVVVDASRSGRAIAELRAWMSGPRADRKPLSEQPFAATPLTASDATQARELLWADHVAFMKETRVEEMTAKELKTGNASMKFETVDFPPEKAAEGTKPAKRALFISMHGGGHAPASVNDSQWRNQVRLGNVYRPVNAIYVAPRGPANTYDLWFVAAVDDLFDRMIEDMIVFNDVDANQVYLMGYSAGGDGAYQLAPRMADRFAAASAMAGHPNDSSPLGLRNLPFTIHVGANDQAYGRNEIAKVWGKRLDDLQAADPKGYEHFVHIHADRGHWMNLEDKEAIPWMQKFRRNPLPEKIVWRQANAVHDRFYWLAAEKQTVHVGDEIIAERNGQAVTVKIKAGKPRVKVRFNDAMVNLDEPVAITLGAKEVFNGKLPRTIVTLNRTIEDRGDPESIFAAEYELPAEYAERRCLFAKHPPAVCD